MELSPDEVVYWTFGYAKLNKTIVTTWFIIFFLSFFSWLVTRKMTNGIEISRWQNFLEIVVGGIRDQIGNIGIKEPEKYIGFIGTLFLFIATSNIATIFPWYDAPTGSLSTTIGLAFMVFCAVPFYGIAQKGIFPYLKSYIQPTVIMLPFNIITEVSRTFALAIRLFGNIMSGSIILAILLSIVPLLFPIIMTVLGLLTGIIQAFIFAVLSTVYIAAAVQNKEKVKSN
ncbi:MAG: F0F1 ATP synthase subunit A [Leptospira sp.]|jgi:F-type H+-transporting ATPase subunit a|nr:F0F1 ATP synthase subunit A [Leptospira sp.]